MGRIIEVEYHVPVICEVDIEDGTVIRVVEDVERIEQTGRISAVDEGYIDADETVRAFKIAQDTDWPAWDRGI